MTSRRPVRIAIVVFVIAAAFTVDQLTKAWALASLDDRVVELGLGIRLELVFNPGVAFGLGGDLGTPLVIALILVSLALVGWVLTRAVQGGTMPGTIFLALAAGGAIGNVWDRISRATDGPLTGEVVDFIAVDWFAIFNVADIFTTCGIAAWALTTVLRPRQHDPIATIDIDPLPDKESHR
jgi:signal peptidase II